MVSSSNESTSDEHKFVKRHRVPSRIWHWISAALLITLLMSGLMIFNAHPRLYWGSYGANPDPAWLSIESTRDTGFVQVGGVRMNTTGVLGLTTAPNGAPIRRAFPSWATIPRNYNLAEARRWHLTAAWFFGLGTAIFAIWSFLGGHAKRDLFVRWAELSPSHLFRDAIAHFRPSRGKHTDHLAYNSLQKLSYLAVTGIIIPTLILTGLTMSPWINAVVPWLLDLFGGRQSARSIHFICAAAVSLFIVVHLAMVLVSGPFNQIRAMITGWYRLPKRDDT